MDYEGNYPNENKMAAEHSFEDASIEELQKVVNYMNSDIRNLHDQRFKVERILLKKMEQQQAAFHAQRELFLGIINPPESDVAMPMNHPRDY